MLAQYRAIAKLGAGGMAEVRLALAQRAGGFNKLLVLKLLREELAADAEFREMFLAEAKVAALLNHPNIVQTNEIGTDGDRFFMAMEYLEGQPLSALIARVGRKNMPLDVHVFALTQVLHGLHYAHALTDLNGTALSLIHRDVSPQNVFLTYAGQVKLLDFGIAKIVGAVSVTRHGVLKGKLGYMAPEQARMSMDIDRRADLFSVGVMLWEALARQRFVPPSETEGVTIQRRLSNEDRKLSEIAPDADPTLAAICEKAVAFNPEDRWPDAQAFAEALEGWLPRSKNVLEKQLGTLLTDHFREERSRIRRVIEEESAKPLEEMGRSSPDLGSLVGGGETSGAGAKGTDGSSATSGLVLTNQLRQRRLKQTMLITFLALGLVGAFIFYRRSQASNAGGGVVTNPTPDPSHSAAPASSIAVRVRATPANATVAIDDGPQRPAPYDGTATKDPALHKLKVSADGYDVEERAVSFDSDVDLSITLRKRLATGDSATATPPNNGNNRWTRPPVVIPPRGKPTTTTQDPTPPPTAPTSTTRKPRHEIDPNDPYAQ